MQDELVGFFDALVPEEFLLDTVGCLTSSYAVAHDRCKADFPREEAHDLYPQMRRAVFESSWRTIAARYERSIATAQLNETGNYYHTEVRFDRVVLTASAVPNPRTIVRDAKFRQTYARSSQLAFYFVEQQPPPIEEPLFGILLHGPEEGRPSHLGFVNIVFPSPDCSQYLERIDLLLRVAHRKAVTVIEDANAIAEEPAVRLKTSSESEQFGA